MPTRAGANPFAALVAAHLKDLQTRRWSLTAQSQARLVLPALFLHLREDGVHDPRHATEEHLVRFARRLVTKGLDGTKPLALHSQAAYLSAVKRFFAFEPE